MSPTDTSLAILAAAHRAWNALEPFRANRRRCMRFTYGDQWSDPCPDLVSLGIANEGERARAKGHRPMTNNLIRRLVRCIVGRFRMQLDEAPARSGVEAEIADINELDELDSRTLEEFIISGCAIQKVVSECRPYGSGVWVDYVTPDRFFFSAIADPRCRDVELLGMLHDMSLVEVTKRWGGNSPERINEIARIYADGASASFPSIISTSDTGFYSSPQGRCRVIEVWTLETSDHIFCHDPEVGTIAEVEQKQTDELSRLNSERKKQGRRQLHTSVRNSVCWRCRWMAPDGSVLGERVADIHPFVLKLYPLTDGAVHSLVEDVIDQQIYINRLITLADHVMGSSAKGALLFPLAQKIPGAEWTDIARRWAAPDGVIPIVGAPGVPEPRQVAGNGADGGARELLQIQMRMFEDVSGVSNALMGRSTSGGNAGVDRYEAEVKNATISILDILRTFDNFRLRRDRLLKKNQNF